MNEICQNIAQQHIINYIKQNILNNLNFSQEEIDDTRFIFADLDENNFQCLVIGKEQGILRYNDFGCEFSDITGNTNNYTKSWRDFMLACVSGNSNKNYSVINFKDCIAAYMLALNTNVVAHSEAQDWANFLQSYMTNHNKNVIVLSDEESMNKFKNKDDELIACEPNYSYLRDEKESIDLSDYLFSSINENIFDDFMRSLDRYTDDKYKSR